MVIRLGDPRGPCLLDLVLVPAVRIGGIILQGLGSGEVVIRGRGGNNVALASDLSAEASYRASDYVEV